jgi:hypothetical protein
VVRPPEPEPNNFQRSRSPFSSLAHSYPDLRNHTALFAVAIAGTYKSYWFTFLLLDCLTMSTVLQAVTKSLTHQWQQLLQTFALFLIVICCYTAAAYYVFGAESFEIFDLDENGNPTYDPACNTLAECFFFSLYVGFRTGDLSEAMGDAQNPGDFTGDFPKRLIYDLSFFVILGVLLFDMVTGIILDAFSELREIQQERQDKMSSETFVSGLDRVKIDEIEGNSVDFKAINEVDQ